MNSELNSIETRGLGSELLKQQLFKANWLQCVVETWIIENEYGAMAGILILQQLHQEFIRIV